MVAVRQRTLDFDGALGGLQSAAELNQEGVADGLDLSAVEAGKKRTQQLSVFFEQLQRQRLVALGQRAVADHIREHDRGQLAVFGVVAHQPFISSPGILQTSSPPASRLLWRGDWWLSGPRPFAPLGSGLHPALRRTN